MKEKEIKKKMEPEQLEARCSKDKKRRPRNEFLVDTTPFQSVFTKITIHDMYLHI